MSFVRHLEARKRNLEEFVALLKEEQILYSTVTLLGDEMIALAERKNALALKAEQLSNETNLGLARLNYPLGRAGAERVATESGCLKTWEEIVDLAMTAKVQNEVNGTLLQMRWEPTKQMSALLQKLSGAALYGPDGKSARNAIGGVSAKA
jgi:flagellar biosynthesis/type III secretory pathway chaperone